MDNKPLAQPMDRLPHESLHAYQAARDAAARLAAQNASLVLFLAPGPAYYSALAPIHSFASSLA